MEPNPTPELKRTIKELILRTLNITDVKSEDIKDEESLFESNILGLDSIDGLEIVVALQREFNVRIDDQNLARFIVRSIDTIAEFIAKEQTKKGKM